MKRILFSKLVQACNLEDVAKHAKELGFSGIDLTCRMAGHVLPENVSDELPKAVKYLNGQGLEVPMISTGITSGEEVFARNTFEAASKCGVKIVKLGYWWCDGFGKIGQKFQEAAQSLDRIEKLAKETGVCAVIHIHSGNAINAIPAVIQALLSGRDTDHVGAYVDPGHMAVEGGYMGWSIGLDILTPYIKIVAVKNFTWVSQEAGNYTIWREKVYPLKGGIAPWPKVLEILVNIGYDGCLSFHSEYLDQHSWKVMDLEEALGQTRADMEYFDEIEGALPGLRP